MRPPVPQPDCRSLENPWNWQPVGAYPRAVRGGIVHLLRHKGGDDPVVVLSQGELQQQPIFSRTFGLGGHLFWSVCIVFVPGLPGWAGIHGWSGGRTVSGFPPLQVDAPTPPAQPPAPAQGHHGPGVAQAGQK